MKKGVDQSNQNAGSASSADLIERLLRRRDEPLGVINVSAPQRLYDRTTGWVAQRFSLLEHWKDRYQGVAAAPSNVQLIPATPVPPPAALPDTAASIAARVRAAKQAALPKVEPDRAPLPSGRFRVSRHPAPPGSPATARAQASLAPQTPPVPSAPNPSTDLATGAVTEASGLSKSSDLPDSSDPSEDSGASLRRASPPGAEPVSADVSRHRSAPDLPVASASPATEYSSGERWATVLRMAVDDVGTSDVRGDAPREANGQLVRTGIRRDSPGREKAASSLAVVDLPIAAQANTMPTSDQLMPAPFESEIIPVAGVLTEPGSSGDGPELPARPVEASGVGAVTDTQTGVLSEAKDSRTGLTSFAAIAGPTSKASMIQERPAATAKPLARRRAEAWPAVRPLAFAPKQPAIVWREADLAASLDGALPGGIAVNRSEAARHSRFSAATGGSQLARQAVQRETAPSAPEMVAQPTSAPAASLSAGRQIDIAELAEQVSKLLGRQLAAERERRGIK